MNVLPSKGLPIVQSTSASKPFIHLHPRVVVFSLKPQGWGIYPRIIPGTQKWPWKIYILFLRKFKKALELLVTKKNVSFFS